LRDAWQRRGQDSACLGTERRVALQCIAEFR